MDTIEDFELQEFYLKSYFQVKKNEAEMLAEQSHNELEELAKEKNFLDVRSKVSNEHLDLAKKQHDKVLQSDTLQRKALARAKQKGEDFQKRILAGEKAITNLKKRSNTLDQEISNTKIQIVKGNAEIKKLQQARPELESQADELDILVQENDSEISALYAEIDYIKSQPGLLDASGRLQPVKMKVSKNESLQKLANHYKVNDYLVNAQEQKDHTKTVPLIISQVSRMLSEADKAETDADKMLDDKMKSDQKLTEYKEQNQLLSKRLTRFQTFKISYCVRFLNILLDCGKQHLRLDGLHYEDSILPALVAEVKKRPGQEMQILSLNLSNNLFTDGCLHALTDMLELLAYLELLDLRGNRFTPTTWAALHENLNSAPGITRVLEHSDRLEAHSGNRLRLRILTGKQKTKSTPSSSSTMNYDDMTRKKSSSLPAIANAVAPPTNSKKHRQQQEQIERAMQREVCKELDDIRREREAVQLQKKAYNTKKITIT